jgi:hypothetical protein
MTAKYDDLVEAIVCGLTCDAIPKQSAKQALSDRLAERLTQAELWVVRNMLEVVDDGKHVAKADLVESYLIANKNLSGDWLSTSQVKAFRHQIKQALADLADQSDENESLRIVSHLLAFGDLKRASEVKLKMTNLTATVRKEVQNQMLIGRGHLLESWAKFGTPVTTSSDVAMELLSRRCAPIILTADEVTVLSHGDLRRITQYFSTFDQFDPLFEICMRSVGVKRGAIMGHRSGCISQL